jgi:hypothetical protein
MRFLLAVCCFLTLMLNAPVSTADVPRPKPTEQKENKVAFNGSLEVTTDPKGYQARLLISQSDLKLMLAAAEGTSGDTTIAASIAQSPTRTIIAGVLLFFSVSFAGVFLARSIRKSAFGPGRKALVAVILVVVTVSAAAIITRGNAGPPAYYRWRNLPQALTQGQSTTGEVRVEIVPDSGMPHANLKLIIPLRNVKPGEE